jgi:hypothetical protein
MASSSKYIHPIATRLIYSSARAQSSSDGKPKKSMFGSGWVDLVYVQGRSRTLLIVGYVRLSIHDRRLIA